MTTGGYFAGCSCLGHRSLPLSLFKERGDSPQKRQSTIEDWVAPQLSNVARSPRLFELAAKRRAKLRARRMAACAPAAVGELMDCSQCLPHQGVRNSRPCH